MKITEAKDRLKRLAGNRSHKVGVDCWEFENGRQETDVSMAIIDGQKVIAKAHQKASFEEALRDIESQIGSFGTEVELDEIDIKDETATV